jgi:hypothetical protein
MKRGLETYSDVASTCSTTSCKKFRIENKAILNTYQYREMTEKDLDEMFDYFTSSEFYEGADVEVTVDMELTKDGETHAHMYYARMDNRIDCTADHFEWKGMKPNVQPNTARSGFRTACERGHFYLQNRFKTGHIAYRTNHEVVGVRTKWVKDMADQGKMKHGDVLKCAAHYNCMTSNLKRDMEVQLMQKKVDNYTERKLKISKILAAKRKVFKEYRVIQIWAQQYFELRDRYKFLIIWGSLSQCGKSQLAKSLFDTKFVHKDCINWKLEGGYDYDKHECVIFNDVKNIYEYVLDERDMFQAGEDIHTVHSSATNWNSMDIWLYRKPIIITTNQDPIYKEYSGNCVTEWPTWIRENAYILEVTEQTWHDNPRPNWVSMKFELPSLNLDLLSIIDSESNEGFEG